MKKVFQLLVAALAAGVILVSITACTSEKEPAAKDQGGAIKEKQDESGGNAKSKKAGDVFSAAEASQVMGAQMAEGSTNPDLVPGGAKASFQGFANDGQTPDTKRAITVALFEFPDNGQAQSYFKEAKELAKEIGGNPETVGALGDDAYWAPETLYVLVGRVQLAVTIIQPEKGGLDKAKEAAKIIIPRL